MIIHRKRVQFARSFSSISNTLPTDLSVVDKQTICFTSAKQILSIGSCKAYRLARSKPSMIFRSSGLSQYIYTSKSYQTDAVRDCFTVPYHINLARRPLLGEPCCVSFIHISHSKSGHRRSYFLFVSLKYVGEIA